MRLSEEDHYRITEVAEAIIKTHHTGELTLHQASEALAQIITAAAFGNQTEVREWINGERFARWKVFCRVARIKVREAKMIFDTADWEAKDPDK